MPNILKIFCCCCCLFLVGCGSIIGGGGYDSIDSYAERHRAKLRRHFMGERVGDVSTLISETRAISNDLKRAGMMAQANKFDSYTDVLMYGNWTIEESMRDVMELVRGRSGGGGISSGGVGGGAAMYSSSSQGYDTDDCSNVFFIRWFRALHH